MIEVSKTHEIQWLYNELDASEYGKKASNLGFTKFLNEFIPEGLVLSKDFVSDLNDGLVNNSLLGELESKFDYLTENSNYKIIVRSSSKLEWINGNSFSGQFPSIHNIESFQELLDAIKEIYLKSSSKEILEYVTKKGYSIVENHMAVIIQRQIPHTQSAIMAINKNQALIEIFNNNIIASVEGTKTPICTIELVGDKVKYNNNSYNSKFKPLFKTVIQFCNCITPKLTEQFTLQLEIGIDNKKISVFQVNRIDSNYLSNRSEMLNTLFENSNFPSKAESMRKFSKMNLFSEKLSIFKSSEPSEKIFNNILNKFNIDKGITVRISDGNSINLPRGFFTSAIKLKAWLKKYSKSDNQDIIVHPYLNVNRSFEMLINKTECLVEHIPGMWESENKHNPDVLYIGQKQSKAWRWKENRNNLQGINSEQIEELSRPISKNQIISWQSRLDNIINNLREEFFHLLPLNFHFVEVDSGNWNFLNIRPGFTLELPYLAHSEPHIIKSKKDIFSWDEVSPLQFSISFDRGTDENLLEMINLLPESKGQAVVVDFGLLSHPAMILREYGYNLVPNYLLNSNRKALNGYIIEHFDIGSDPINRILSEPAIYEDNEFKVVLDKDEIVQGHLLLITKEPYTSLTEIDNLEEKLMQIKAYLLDNKTIGEYLLIERGRARFCTSGFTDSHAHAHLLPLDKLSKNALTSFLNKIKAKESKNLFKTIEIAKKSKNEYILLIENLEHSHLLLLPDNTSVEKQFIRKHFGNGRTE